MESKYYGASWNLMNLFMALKGRRLQLYVEWERGDEVRRSKLEPGGGGNKEKIFGDSLIHRAGQAEECGAVGNPLDFVAHT